MVFTTNLFLFLFLPIFLLFYYLLPIRFRSGWILVASYFFYGWWRPDFVLLLLGVTVLSYYCGTRIAASRGGSRQPRLALALGVGGNLAALAYFKYFNFALDNVNALRATLELSPLAFTHVILPIGLSFYIFQAISYLVDLYRGDAEPARSFWDLSAFIALFPQLIAGPILRYKDLSPQFNQRSHTIEKFSEGSLRFMVGFCKKVLIADSIAGLVEAAFNIPQPTFADAWLGGLSYTVQLYFDFSGYSDMAIGLGLMMGFEFKENFNHPYISRSITEFWKRWHISLSRWLRDYLYIPLGGNRRGSTRTYVNLLIVMLLGGLWHGANWTFVVWGAWHGAFLVLERRKRGASRWGILAGPRTLLLVILGWIVFRAPTLSAAGMIYKGMIGLHGVTLSETLQWQMTGTQVAALFLGGALVYLGPLWRNLVSFPGLPLQRMSYLRIAIIPLFVLAVLRLSAQSFSPFLYFQF